MPRAIANTAGKAGKHYPRLLAPTMVLTGLILGCAPAMAQSQSSDLLALPRLQEPIELDGSVEEPAWDRARAISLTQHKPVFGADPTEKTEVLIGYTDEHLYVACRCYDHGTPSGPSFKRDFYSSDSDYFTLELDTFNDNENAVAFETTPTGLRADQSIANDAAGDSPADNDWDTRWDVEVTQTGEGWFAEMRIPISSLRFQSNRGRVVMGLILTRYIARKSEILVYPAIPPDWGAWSPWKPSQAQDVVFLDLESRTPLHVTPYVLGGLGQQAVLNPSETGYDTERDFARDIGLDVKLGLASNLTLDLTLNTDFAQAEADDQQVNLTRFPLFFPEKRRFFLERRSNFAFDFGGPNRLFYSRRIGLHEGEPVRILGGARLVGRAGPWDIGLLSMQTARQVHSTADDPLPSENLSVARLRRRVLNPYSYVGGILTSRVDEKGAYHVSYGVDAIFRVLGDEYVSLKWAQTFEDGAPHAIASLDAARTLLQWERRRYAGLSYDLRYSRAGSGYRPAVGFELREDYVQIGDRIGYGWIPGRKSVLQRHRVNLGWEAYFRNGDRSLESLELEPTWEFHTDGGHRLTLGGSHRIEDLRDTFSLSGAVAVPSGRYVSRAGRISYGMPAGERLRTSVGIAAGEFYDGWLASLRLTPTWNASRHLRVVGTYEFSRIHFPEREQAFAAHLGRIRLEVTPNTRLSLEPFVQYNSALGGVATNLRIRYNAREGTDLFVVYNEGLNTDRSFAKPRLPVSSHRTVLLKYTHTFGR